MNRFDLRVGATLFYKEEDMINFGLVAPEPNPFVCTGLPKPGQVWCYKNNPNLLVHVTKYSAFGHGQVNYTILNKASNIARDDRYLTEVQFLERYMFSH